MEIVVCPNCGANASSEDFTCGACSVILNAAALEDEPVSLVEALLSPTNSGIHHTSAVVDDRSADVTVRGTVLMDEFTVPHLLVGVEVALQPLHPFEAYVASFIDGRNSVPQIATAAEISNLEAMAILRTLAFRNVVRLDRDEQRLPGLAPELDEEPRTDTEGLSEGELQSVLQANGLAQPESPEELRARLLEADDFPSLPPPPDDEEELPPPAPAASSPALLAGPGALASAARAARGTPASGVSSARAGSATPAGGVRGTNFPSPPGGTAASGSPPGGGAFTGSGDSRPTGTAAVGSGVLSTSRPGGTAAATSGLAARSPPAGTASAGSGAAGNSRPWGTPSAGSGAVATSHPGVPGGGNGSRPGGTPAAGSSPSPRASLLQDRPAPYQASQSIEYTLERAVSLERRGDLEGAIYVLKKAIAQSKNAAPLYNKLALALVKRREFAEAVSLLEKAVAIAPEESSYQQNLYKVMGLTASLGKGAKSDKGGVLSKLLGRK